MWNRLLIGLLERVVKRGDLTVDGLPGGTRRFGDGGPPSVRVRLQDSEAARRLVTYPMLTLGEVYMDGGFVIENDDLRGLMELLLQNRAAGNRNAIIALQETLNNLLRPLLQINRRSKSRSNVAHHYDLNGDLYALFLDPDRQYSCAYFRSPDVPLDQAQIDKKHHIARKLCLQPGMRVLDIGCGWGGMALTLAQDYGAQVTGITLSQEQLSYAQARVQAAGLQDRIELRLQDYRDVTGSFDRVVSVGMFEHVGLPNYDMYFRKVHDVLTPDGIALIHTIGCWGRPGATNPWVTKYIFPGGHLPSLSELSPPFQRSGLVVSDIEVLRLHYALTLRHWYDRFMENIDKARALYDERFCRMWRFYLIGSEMSFRVYENAVFQLQFGRHNDSVPLTRDYMQGA